MNDEGLLKKILEILETNSFIGDIADAEIFTLARSLQGLFLEECARRITKSSSTSDLASPYIDMTPEEFSNKWSL